MADLRLIAEQAVLRARAVKQAGDVAPHGKGLAGRERTVMEHGQELLRVTTATHHQRPRRGAKKG